MKKRTFSLISLTLALLMLVSAFASCDGGNEETKTTDALSTESVESVSTEGETKPLETEDDTLGTEGGTEPREETEEVTTAAPQLDCDNAELIEYANSIANGVNAYYPDGTRQSFVFENKNMSIQYALSPTVDQQVTVLKNSKGKVYLENNMDVFVRTTEGKTLYASKSTAPAYANLHRLGYYYYDVRLEGQSFDSEPVILKEKSLNIKTRQEKNVILSYVNGKNLSVEITGEDPYIVLDHSAFKLSDYNYVQITMKASPRAFALSHMIYAMTNSMNNFNNDVITVFDPILDGEEHTYNVSLAPIGDISNSVTRLRIDFDGAPKGTKYEISSIKLLKTDTSGQCPYLSLNRSFLVYSDKMHQVAQVAATQVTEGIAEVGFSVSLEKNRISGLVIKDKEGLHKSLDGVDQDSIEFVGFDVSDAGVLGFINPTGEYEGRMTLRLTDGTYVLEHVRVPENNTIIPSVEGTDNGNDFLVGQRVYTSDDHDLDSFVYEAEAERRPLTEKNIILNNASPFTSVKGYDALRGVYVVNLQVAHGFSIPFYQSPNRHYIADLSFRGDNLDRKIYLLAAGDHGCLECSVLLDERQMLLPVPVEVTKNFCESSGGERNLFNLDDTMYSEAILPIVINARDKVNYTVIHLYQNWGRYPLKQISSIQSVSPYYHLSTGVTESNCITPQYVTRRAYISYKNLNMLPDHRAASAPYWESQPQHTLGGYHYFLQYTDAEGNYSASENIKNTIDSYGPTYSDIKMDYLSFDGKIKVSYTHMEMPQLDENRTYYTMRYEVLEDVSFADFRRDFAFYSVRENRTGSNYTKIGYLDSNNESKIVDANASAEAVSYVLGNDHPYFDYFCIPDYTNENGYVNLAFLIRDYSFIIGGEKCDAPFLLTDRDRELFLSLDLGEVTLKAGDTFSIDAILLPWGSQESIYDGSNGKAPDQNVLNVRADSILDPLKATPLEDCETVDSVYLPKVRTTNGKSASFTLSGGENNVSVRVYGFDILTAPKIYEKVGGEWIEYVVNSSKTPDNEGNSHHYDGYMVHYDGDGTFSYSFVTDLTGDQERTFKLVADTPFEAWPPEGEDEIPVGVLLKPEDFEKVAQTSRGIGEHAIITEGDHSFFRIYGDNTAGEGYTIPYVASGSRETGSVVFLKYRIPTENKESAGSFEIFTSTKTTSPGPTDKVECNVVVKDGEWHVIAIELAKTNHPTFKPENDGRYFAGFLRLDFFSQKMSTDSYIDIEYFGLCTSLEEVYEMASDMEAVSLITGNGTKETLIDPKTGNPLSTEPTKPDEPKEPEETKDYSDLVLIDPESEYTASTVQFASALDMINGMGMDGAPTLKNRGGSSVKGVDVLDYPITTVNSHQVIFSGWTVAEGGVKDYVWSCDGGKTWNKFSFANNMEKISNGAEAHLNAASARLNGLQYADKVNSLNNCRYQGDAGAGAAVAGLAADLSQYVGQTVSITFAAVPQSAPNTLCLIAHLPNVTVE